VVGEGAAARVRTDSLACRHTLPARRPTAQDVDLALLDPLLLSDTDEQDTHFGQPLVVGEEAGLCGSVDGGMTPSACLSPMPMPTATDRSWNFDATRTAKAQSGSSLSRRPFDTVDNDSAQWIARGRAGVTRGPALLADIPALVLTLRLPKTEGGLSLKDRRFLGVVVKNCFVGRSLLKWLKEHTGCDGAQALQVALQLHAAGFFRHYYPSFGFSAVYYFFWRPDEEVAGLIRLAEDERLLRA
jgi:hypothetical protein